jgi:hypothetical protein
MTKVKERKIYRRMLRWEESKRKKCRRMAMGVEREERGEKHKNDQSGKSTIERKIHRGRGSLW